MYFVAEVGINHNGDIDIAKKLITMAKGCGADAVKFQKRTIPVVYDKEFLDSPRDSPWGTTQRDQKEGLEFSPAEYDEIDRFCKTVGIPWFGSAWDIESLYFLDQYQPPFHKIASAMITNMDYMEQVAKIGKTTIISHLVEQKKICQNQIRSM